MASEEPETRTDSNAEHWMLYGGKWWPVAMDTATRDESEE